MLPEIKSIQKAQYKLDNHLEEVIPLQLEAGGETGSFDYCSYTEFLLEKYGLLDIINNADTTDCFRIKMALAKDTKQLYQDEFAYVFQFLKDYVREKGFRVKFLFLQDMSSIWKTTGPGGTAKVKTFPCYCCAMTSRTLVAAQPKEECFCGNCC